MPEDAESTVGAQRDPEDDPFRCSICGHPLGTVERVEGADHCDGCIREYVGDHAVSGGGRGAE